MSHPIIILGYTVALGIPEIVIFSLAAILLGFSIHFYWFGRRSVPGIQHVYKGETLTISKDEQWRLEFYEELEQQQKIQNRLERELSGAKEAEKLLLRELDDSRSELSRLSDLHEKMAKAEKIEPEPLIPSPSSAYMTDLVIAQQNLNEFLSKEMTERLQKAYQEFNFLQDRIQKIESTIIEPHSRQHEFEGLQEAYYKITKECDEVKLRNLTLLEENQRLTRSLSDTEEKLRDANFQKIQLAKKVVFLEELANDLQQVAGHHKRLEAQLKRISEIEGLLSQTTSHEK